MKVLILAGGRGTRLGEETGTKPKPMMEIGGRPLLWHIMCHFANHGFTEFGIALGYKGSVIKQYFLDYRYLHNSITVQLQSGQIDIHDRLVEDWTIDLIETGLETQTGGRIKRMTPWLNGTTFMMTYGDGVATVNIRDLLTFHQSHGRLATVTAVRPPARFGGLRIGQGHLVSEFSEKSQLEEGWINGGFFVLERGVLDYIEEDGTVFEREPLERLAKDGQLAAYRHDGFWHCVDTLRDLQLLEQLWQDGRAPWKV